MTYHLRTAILATTLLLFTSMTLWLPVANAAMLATGTAEKNPITTRADNDVIKAFLQKDKVQQQLIQLGVKPEMAIARVASMTAEERRLLEEKITDLPAGAGVVEVIGIVFIVLLILELLGVTDIFKKI
ncbi:MAG: PA2779 family protein [Arenicellales bacterium]